MSVTSREKKKPSTAEKGERQSHHTSEIAPTGGRDSRGTGGEAKTQKVPHHVGKKRGRSRGDYQEGAVSEQNYPGGGGESARTTLTEGEGTRLKTA